MHKFKECRCGSRIPAEWVECQECLVQGVKLRGERRSARLRRSLQAKRRVTLGKSMAEVLSEPKHQASKILAARAEGKKRQADRAAIALREWYSE